MNTEVIEFIKKMMQKEFFWIDCADTILSIVVIITGVAGFAKKEHMLMYAIAFSSAAMLFLLNSYKGYKIGNKNTWVYLAASIICLAIAVAFLVMILMS